MLKLAQIANLFVCFMSNRTQSKKGEDRNQKMWQSLKIIAISSTEQIMSLLRARSPQPLQKGKKKKVGRLKRWICPRKGELGIRKNIQFSWHLKTVP